MATEKTVNYTASQEKIILEAIDANGGVANQSVAETLAADPRMNDAAGEPRKVRSIIAKMRRMAETDGFTYARKVATTKDGKEIVKKAELVAQIAGLADVTVARLDGLEKASKGALETIAAALRAA